MSSMGDISADSDSPPSCSQLSSSDEENHVQSKRKPSQPTYKANLNDTFDRQIEVKSLQSQMNQLQSELSIERESAIGFRKKLTLANKEKFEQAARFNEEACKLQTQNAGLQAQIERQGEFTEQLEFELTRTKKQLDIEQKLAKTREQQGAESLEQLEELLNEAKSKIKSLESQSTNSEKSTAAQIEQLRETIADRDRILRESVQEQQNVIAERNTLNEMLQQQQETIQEHRSQFEELKAEFDKTREHLCEVNAQLKSLSSTEQEHREEMETLRRTNKDLTEAIEAEKSTHLESKFNSELVQLKINDLENALDAQKCCNDELQESVDNLSGQLRELERAYNEEMNEHRNTKVKLDKCEKEYALSQRQLQAELTDKRTLVTNLKLQLDQHQTNVDDLKTELNRARKRQQYFEETYGGSMRELELLVANFDLEADSYRPRGSRSGDADDNKPLSPNVILDMIKHTLRIYKQQLEQTTSELKKLSETYDNVCKEDSTRKDKLWAKERALEETQKALNQTTKDVDLLRMTTNEQEQRLAGLSADLKAVKKEYDTLQAKYSGLTNDLTDTKMKHLQQDEQKMRFIHGLYQRLISPSSANQKSGDRKVKVQTYEKFKWDDLSEMVLEQTVTLMAQVNQLKEQSSRLDKDLGGRDERIEAMKREYDSEIAKMNKLMEKSGEEWNKEKQALQSEYQRLQADHERQQQLSQKSYDEAWEQVRQTSGTVEHMEREVADLKTRITVLQKHNSSLLCAFALMCGAYYPLLDRSRNLARQRNLLEDQVQKYVQFKKQVCTLLQTLGSEGLGGDTVKNTSAHSLLKFRKLVITVIAARRLRMLPHSAKSVFTFTDSQNTQGLVSLGSIKYSKRRRGSFSDRDPTTTKADEMVSEADIIDWLSNKEVISTIMSCTEDAMDALKRYSSKDKVCRPGFVISAARTSFKKLLTRLETLYPAGGTDVSPSPHKERHTMAKLLGRGLHEAMTGCHLDNKSQLMPSQQILTNLQERVLSFIKLLHDSEIERKKLRNRVASLSDSEHELRKNEQVTEQLELELAVLRNQTERMVSSEKYESLVVELNQTLSREKEAQQLLREQSEKVRDITKRLDEEEYKRTYQEGKLRETMEAIEAGKADVGTKADMIAQLKRRVSQLELERTQLQDNVYDAEQTLRTASKDREYLNIYVKALLTAFEKCRSDVVHKDISKALCSKSLLPECTPTSEMLCIQSLVNAFTDSLRATQNHMTGLSEEITSHKKHIARLKDELSAACRRQLSGPVLPQAEDDFEAPAAALPREEDYNRLQSTRLGHYQDKDISPRFDKSIEIESLTDFMSVGNEPEFSNGETPGPSRSTRRKTPTGRETSPTKCKSHHHPRSPFKAPAASKKKYGVR